MTCLFRVAYAKFRHIRSNIKMTDRILERIATFNMCVAAISLLWHRDQQRRIIPIANKYLLVGEQTTIQKVKSQIIAEYQRSILVNKLYNRKIIDIEILKKGQQSEIVKDDKSAKTVVLLCLSTETDYTKEEYYMPDAIPNIECKYVLVETYGGENELFHNLCTYVKTHGNLFKGCKVTPISPVTELEYINPGVDEFDRIMMYCYYSVSAMAKVGLIGTGGAMGKGVRSILK